MGTPAERSRPAADEPSSLVLLRPLRRTFLVIAVISFAVSMLFLFLKLPSAIVPAAVFVASFGVFALAALLEHSARFRSVTPPIEVQVGEPIDTVPERIATTRDPYPAEAFPAPPPEVRAAQERSDRAESTFGLVIVGVILVIALILAAAVLGSRLLAAGALIIFLVLALFGAPFWLAATQERADDERRRLKGDPGSNR